jgi:CheY-like chemotaxis protein
MAKRILIIDDEQDMQIYLATLFKKVGYETSVAHDGEQGLQMAREFRPHLITLDLLMPKQSGVLAYEALRASPDTRTTPVVVITGMEHSEELTSSSAALPPPEAVFDKPIDRDALLETVETLIGPREG